ncbi:hypothetical protein ACOSQ3_014315 [Xanthoceras sorbifolium]
MVTGTSKLLSGYFSPEARKLLALREGLLLAIQHGLCVKQVECDAANVILGVNSSDIEFCNLTHIFNDVKALCKDVDVVSCLVISRKGNTLAHTLASLNHFLMEDRV